MKEWISFLFCNGRPGYFRVRRGWICHRLSQCPSMQYKDTNFTLACDCSVIILCHYGLDVVRTRSNFNWFAEVMWLFWYIYVRYVTYPLRAKRHMKPPHSVFTLFWYLAFILRLLHFPLFTFKPVRSLLACFSSAAFARFFFWWDQGLSVVKVV